jgi:hypothetical protein
MTDSIKSKFEPMAIVIGTFVVLGVIELAKLGYYFGIWLKFIL